MAVSTAKIKVGILGLGRSGYGIHIHNLKQIADKYEVVTFYDPLTDRADAVAAELGLQKSNSEEELLSNDDVELVIVASPNLLHAEQAERALKAGKHVLCEKPFGLTLAQTDAMIAASKASGKVLQPFQQRRYEKDFQKVKEICESGLLGDIQEIRICWHGFKRRWDWQTLRSCGGGALNNNGPHPLDHAMVLFGEGQPEVWAEAKSSLCSGDAEDHLKVILSGPGHPTIDIELSDVYAFSQERWLVSGTSGALHGTASKLEWKWVDFSTMPERLPDANPTPDRSYNQETLTWENDTWEAETVADSGGGAAPAAQPALDLYAGLYRAIREGVAQEITPEDVRKRIAVMEDIREAAGIPAWN